MIQKRETKVKHLNCKQCESKKIYMVELEESGKYMGGETGWAGVDEYFYCDGCGYMFKHKICTCRENYGEVKRGEKCSKCNGIRNGKF